MTVAWPPQWMWSHIADKNGAVLDILPKYPSGHSHSQLQLQIYLEKMVLTKQTDVLLSRRACIATTANNPEKSIARTQGAI